MSASWSLRSRSFFTDGFEERYVQHTLDGLPESFNNSNGAGFSNGAESLLNAPGFKGIAESFGGELAALIGNKMPWSGEDFGGHLEKVGDGLRIGLF